MRRTSARIGFWILPAILLAGFVSPRRNHAKEIALTFDDCPRSTRSLMTGMERAIRLTEELRKAGVPQAAFFCNSPTRDDRGPERIRYFAEHGHLIANHGATHMNLDESELSDFIADLEQAESELKDFPNYRKWFRFPYLNEGQNPEVIGKMRDYLRRTGYQNGYTTVNDSDWYMDKLLGDALDAGLKFDLNRLCRAYRDIQVDESEFADNMSVQALGRSVKHVIVLHETDLNALCIGEFVKGLRENGWTIISPEEAYQDPIAKRDPSAEVPQNQGRLFALAAEAGYEGPYFSKWNQETAIDDEFARREIWQPARR